jgi:stromal membrane-associated protein
MGTHISRVKSVDLDAWTDEQLQSILRWGNARANKYWEAKLAAGHVPSDGKIENFIRTKYESKRWVMDGPMPDPSTLGDDGDDNVPLNVVRDKAQLDRSASQRGGVMSSGPPSAPGTRRQPTESFDLIGADDPAPPPPRPSTTDTPPNAARAPPPAKPSTPSQLLGGLDFLGDTPERPTSAGHKSGGMSRPDLKQSILSLYAAQPKPSPQSPPSQSSHERGSSFGNMGSPQGTTSPSMGGMNDAFAGLSFGSSSNAPKPSQPPQSSNASAFGGLGQMSPPIKANPAPPQMTSPPMGGGGFFDAGPKPPPKPNAPKASGPSLAVRKTSNASDGFGDFTSGTSAAPPNTSTTKSSSPGLLDFTQTMVNIQPVFASKPTSPPTNSVFNLSQQKQPASQPPASTAQVNYASKMSTDPWGANEWATPDPAPATKQTPVNSPPTKSGSADFGWGSSGMGSSSGFSNEWAQPAPTGSFDTNPTGGWGNVSGLGSGSGSGGFNPPKVTAEEDFGGWSSSTAQTGSTTQSSSSNVPKPFTGGTDDLFSNVWG